MTADNFPRALRHVLASEGGYVDHPRDPGGATNMGITHATLAASRGHPVTKADVRALSLTEAAHIYRTSYWAAVRGDDLPAGLDLVAFDGAVNSGASRGARWLQAGLGVAADGVIGPQTLQAARGADVIGAIKRACAARMTFLRGLRHWGTFGRGWAARVASVEAEAVAMHQDALALPAPARAAWARAEAAQASVTAKAEVRQGLGGAGGAGVGAGGVAEFGNLPPDLLPWLLAGVAILAILALWRAHHRARFQRARAAVYGGAGA